MQLVVTFSLQVTVGEIFFVVAVRFGRCIYGAYLSFIVTVGTFSFISGKVGDFFLQLHGSYILLLQ